MVTDTWPDVGHSGASVDEPDTHVSPFRTSVREMVALRRFIAEVIGDDRAASLSDREWSELCDSVQGVQGDASAVSQLIVSVYSRGRRCEPSVASPADGWLPVAAGTVPPIGTGTDARVPLPDNGASPSADDVLIALDGFGSEASGWFLDPPNPEWSDASTWAAWSLPPDSGPKLDPEPEPVVVAGRRRHRAVRSRAGSRTISSRRRDRLLAVTSWIRNIGAIILLFVAWQLWGTAITQHQSQAGLQSQFDQKVHHVAKPPPGFTLLPVAERIPDPPDGTVMAQIQIPTIGVSQYVVSGTNETDLAKGPGHYLGTAMPGQAGNVAIAGHRTTHGAPFNRLAQLKIGDPVYLTTASGQRLTYIVSAVPVAVSPRDVTVLNNFGDNRLTLTTCNPEYSAIQRLIVVAAYLPPGASHPTAIAKGQGTPYALAPAAVNGWNTSLLPWVLIEVGALVVLGLFYQRLARTFGREGKWLILVPIWLALLLALFETLTNFVPASV